MASFLSSFASEFRTFARLPKVGQVKNAIGEIVKNDGRQTNITGILFKRKTGNTYGRIFNSEIKYDQTTHAFFFEKGQELKKDDYILEDDLKYKVLYVRKVYVFNAEYDHNLAELLLIQ